MTNALAYYDTESITTVIILKSKLSGRNYEKIFYNICPSNSTMFENVVTNGNLVNVTRPFFFVTDTDVK
jgi:hypothetical protein